MKRLKLFLENFLIYGLGGVISKLVPIIMLPIVTRLMPESEYYGINDLSVTIVSLCTSVAVMGMYDAMYRMFFEKEELEYRKDICSTTLVFNLLMSFTVFLLMVIFKKPLAVLFFKRVEYAYLIYICAITTLVDATNGIVAAPVRMQNKRGIYILFNTAFPVLSYTISIPLILKGYKLIALPLSGMIASCLGVVFFMCINRKWFQLKRFRRTYLKELLVIAIPLMPNILIYWLFNFSDRMMITHLMDVEATGVYAIGAKLGSLSQLIYLAFAGGWQYFAFSTMKEKDQVETNSNIFAYLGVISFVCAAVIFALAKPIYYLFFEGVYTEGYVVAPYLFLAPLLQMLFQVAANQFLVVKKTWYNPIVLLTGAVLNLIFNFFLIPVLGIEGAAIATLLGYTISDIICVIVLTKMKLMKLDNRFLGITLCFVAYILAWRFAAYGRELWSLFGSLLVAGACIYAYRKELGMLWSKRKVILAKK